MQIFRAKEEEEEDEKKLLTFKRWNIFFIVAHEVDTRHELHIRYAIAYTPATMRLNHKSL